LDHFCFVIFGGNTILVPTFGSYSYFDPYFLIISHLVPKIKKNDLVFVPTVISLREIVYVKDGMHCWHNKCCRGH